MTPPAEAERQLRQPDHEGAPRRADSERPDLRVYTGAEHLARSQRRRARALLAMSACVVALSLLIVAAANIVVTSRQFKVDSLSSAVSAAVVQNQQLQLRKAQLESPARIISIAEHRLGMVMPKSVTYLPAQPLPPAPSAKHSAARHGTASGGGRSPAR